MDTDFRNIKPANKATKPLFHNQLLLGKTQKLDRLSLSLSASGGRFISHANALPLFKTAITAGPGRWRCATSPDNPPDKHPARTARPGMEHGEMQAHPTIGDVQRRPTKSTGRVNIIISLFLSKTTSVINEVWNARKMQASIFAGDLENVIKTRTL
jgi:hypothetical protein